MFKQFYLVVRRLNKIVTKKLNTCSHFSLLICARCASGISNNKYLTVQFSDIIEEKIHFYCVGLF